MVVRREVVALEADGADPDLGGEIDAREGVESGGAGAAAEGSVGDGLDVAVVADRGDAGGDGDDALAGFDFVAGPDVPRHPDGVDSFRIEALHLCHDLID